MPRLRQMGSSRTLVPPDPPERYRALPERVWQFRCSLTKEETKQMGPFMSKAIDQDLKPDEALYVWFDIHPGHASLTRMAMGKGWGELFELLGSEKGRKWLMRDEGKNLSLFFGHMAKFRK